MALNQQRLREQYVFVLHSGMLLSHCILDVSSLYLRQCSNMFVAQSIADTLTAHCANCNDSCELVVRACWVFFFFSFWCFNKAPVLSKKHSFFCKVPRLRQFVFLVKTTCRRKECRTMVQLMLTGINQSTRRKKTVSVLQCTSQILNGMS